jgi:hypothetical protein
VNRRDRKEKGKNELITILNMLFSKTQKVFRTTVLSVDVV